MLKQIFYCCQKTIYRTQILTNLHLPYINRETRWKRFDQKKSCQIFSNQKVLLISNFQFSLITQYVIEEVCPLNIYTPWFWPNENGIDKE